MAYRPNHCSAPQPRPAKVRSTSSGRLGDLATTALFCANCHTPNGMLNPKELGYSDQEILKLTTPEFYLKKRAEKQKEEWS
jgi:hypothetical protein